jgi:uncharacterized protein YerC
MAKVSQIPLSPKIQEKVLSNFWQVIVDLKKKSEVEDFMNDLLTSTEKTMLSKRLAIALMLEKGADYEVVCKTLKH